MADLPGSRAVVAGSGGLGPADPGLVRGGLVVNPLGEPVGHLRGDGNSEPPSRESWSNSE